MDNYKKEIYEALMAADNALMCLNNAMQHLNSARNWGVVDVMGGGLFSTFAKHNNLNNAEYQLQQAKTAVQALKKELLDVNTVLNVNIEVGDFLTLADYFFDGFVADWLVQSKIKDAQKQVQDAIVQINYIKTQLLNSCV